MFLLNSAVRTLAVVGSMVDVGELIEQLTLSYSLTSKLSPYNLCRVGYSTDENIYIY